MTGATWQGGCVIDGCPNPVTQVIHSYPDDTGHCDKHKTSRFDLSPIDSICPGPSVCALCYEFDWEPTS